MNLMGLYEFDDVIERGANTGIGWVSSRLMRSFPWKLLPTAEHRPTEVWSFGTYVCTCGEAWLNQRQQCSSLPWRDLPRT